MTIQTRIEKLKTNKQRRYGDLIILSDLSKIPYKTARAIFNKKVADYSAETLLKFCNTYETIFLMSNENHKLVLQNIKIKNANNI